MKKTLALVLALLMVLVVFAGCGNGSTPVTSTSDEWVDLLPDADANDSGATVGQAPNANEADYAKNGGKTFNIWGWNNECIDFIMQMATPKGQKVIVSNGDEKDGAGLINWPADVELKYTINTDRDNVYQNVLDATLPLNLSSADPIDMIVIESAFVKKYPSMVVRDVAAEGDVFTPALLSLKTLGITDADTSEWYDYNKEVSVGVGGDLRAAPWQACPGVMYFRRDIAKAVLGSDDEATVQAAVASWDDFYATAEKMVAAGYKMVSSSDDVYRPFLGKIGSKWVTSKDEIQIDAALREWLDLSKKLSDIGANNNQEAWQAGWNADRRTDVFCFFGSPWFAEWCFIDQTLEDPDLAAGNFGAAWDMSIEELKAIDSGTYGKWGIVAGPNSYTWGGTWIGAVAGTDNADLCAEIIKVMTCGEGQNWLANENGQFVNNKAVMGELAAKAPEDLTGRALHTSIMFGGINQLKYYLDAANNLNMKNAGPYDQGCMEALQGAGREYCAGTLATRRDVLANFTDKVLATYPKLTIASK